MLTLTAQLAVMRQQAAFGELGQPHRLGGPEPQLTARQLQDRQLVRETGRESSATEQTATASPQGKPDAD